MHETTGSTEVWAKRWLALSVSCLVLAGLFALFPLLGRMPPLDRFVTDPAFFKRCLVIHVNLALVLWFQAFIAALVCLLRPASEGGLRMAAGFALAISGVVLLLGTGFVPGMTPVLSNYVPALDHPMFFAALASFASGLVLTLSWGRWRSTDAIAGFELPQSVVTGLKAAALAILVAIATFAVSALTTPEGLSVQSRCEALFWGGGHVLQFASVAAMLACWLVLVEGLTGNVILTPRAATLLFVLLVLPTLVAPALAAQGTMSVIYRSGSTALMRFGIFPVTLVVLAACVRAIVRAHRRNALDFRDLRFAGFTTSAGLALTGFVLGALIRGSNTLVPAHYHANIGAVTTAFMTVALLLLEPLGFRAPQPRLARWQPLLFGGGQVVMVLGFAFAGAHGMGRKLYGAEQASRSLAETLGLVTMGLGGLVAVVGGVLFLVLVVPSAWRAADLPARERRLAWAPNVIPDIQSRS